MISRTGTAVVDRAGPLGGVRPRNAQESFESVLGTVGVPDQQPAPVSTPRAVRAPAEIVAVRADTAAVLAIYRAAETARATCRAVRLDLDTGSGTVSMQVASENGRLVVHIHPDAKVPAAVRAAIAEAVRRRAPGAGVHDNGRRAR